MDAGFLVDAISVDEYAPLHYAALSGSLEAAAVLLSHGADPNYAPKNVFIYFFYSVLFEYLLYDTFIFNSS
ncbi:hypothetical protein TRFO_01194 [Tritrichomonas foetus]|uniref:Uncharacterized protein n=1 Tax=Tritrichomonas foetus TaxID=1144522 RepID=A0A1J4KN65_9EUKA|nr:hypothetical protein TRFO_01194 [Tritrichomonas foetus]|eukprot:OHT11236.1 hypothetical protein TRFO_01194 [Tritrichomonas foetus]